MTYADYIVLSVLGSNRNSLEEGGRQILTQMENWALDNKIAISLKKLMAISLEKLMAKRMENRKF